MAIVRAFNDVSPRLGQEVFLAETATVIGDVELGARSNVWYGAVLRGDVGKIRVGRDTNLQDLCCLHMSGGISDVIIGSEVTVGHSAVIHGAIIEDGALIGMGAVLLDNARIGEGAIVAAGSLVTAGTVIPARTLARGSPARVVRELGQAEIERSQQGVRKYVELARLHGAANGPDGDR